MDFRAPPYSFTPSLDDENFGVLGWPDTRETAYRERPLGVIQGDACGVSRAPVLKGGGADPKAWSLIPSGDWRLPATDLSRLASLRNLSLYGIADPLSL
jgi:hypothetical protein